MDSNAEVLRDVFAALRVGDPGSAKATLKSRYPFVPVEKIARRYSERLSMELFLRDGFIDVYTGNRLINPGVLRLLHVLLGDDFPAHPNWKASETHIAFWELFPTVDHLVPVSRGGKDEKSNWVTASMLSNQAKAHWTVGELGWSGIHLALSRSGTGCRSGWSTISRTRPCWRGQLSPTVATSDDG